MTSALPAGWKDMTYEEKTAWLDTRQLVQVGFRLVTREFYEQNPEAVREFCIEEASGILHRLLSGEKPLGDSIP